MTPGDPIVRIAARGDGVTAAGRHCDGAVTGDILHADGTVEAGPHRAVPPCRHFGTCGGCQLQHADEDALRQFVTDRVVHAAEGQGIAIGNLLTTHLSPPRSRRRAALHGQRAGKGAVLGFREAGSHRIVDLRECPVMVPELVALVQPLRRMIAAYGGKAPVDIALTLADQGIDAAISGVRADGLDAAEGLLRFAQEHALARLGLDHGYGPETVWEPEPVTVTLGGGAVGLPPGSFLQPTRDGEAVLVADARAYLAGARAIADLFAGLGTFAFALTEPGVKILAVEAAQAAHLACKAAASARGAPVHALHRDLFRNPLRADEAERFDGLLLDPPRAGAREQVAQIAASRVERVAYISCNPISWARDARMLVDAGFTLRSLRPVGQFRWSTHVELTSLFTR